MEDCLLKNTRFAHMHAVVAGAGVAGIFCAAALAAQGWEVTLLERAKGPNQGLSYAPGFLCFSGLQNPRLYRGPRRAGTPGEGAGFEATLLARIRHRAFFAQTASRSDNAERARRLRLSERFGAWCSELLAASALETGMKTEELPELIELLTRDEAKLLEGVLPDITLMDKAQALCTEPAIADNLPFERAIAVPGAGAFNAVYLSRLLLAKLLAKGASHFRTAYGEALSGIKTKDGALCAVTTSLGREIACEAAVIANGEEAATLLAELSIKLPCAPVTGCTLTLEAEDEACLPAHPLFIPSKSLSIVREGRRLRACGKFFLGARTEAEKKAEYNRLYDAALQALVNFRPVAHSARFWSGQALILPDGFPAAGPVRAVKGLAVSAAHGFHGLRSSAGAASIVACALSGCSGAAAPRAFAQACSPERFAF